MTTPDFSTRDPLQAAFWNERFEKAFTPWNKGSVPADLQAFVQANSPRETLIPGCGHAHEVGFLHAAGWPVTAIDFSPAAVEAARAALGPLGSHVQEADFFAYAPPRPLQMIYERAFLCALPRAMRSQVAARWAALLPPGGLLAGFFFFDDAPKGPPFGISAAELDELLQPAFERIEDRLAADSIPVFQGKERWQVWRRRG